MSIRLGLIYLCLFLAPTRADELTCSGVNIYYTLQGSGSPVVLIHGLHSSGGMNWTMPGITAALAQTHRVIVMDCRGHGKSDKPETDAAYGTAMVEDVVALLTHLDFRKAHIAGYSMGGMIALKMAVMHPERVQSLLLCGMGWLQDGSMLQGFWEHTSPRERLFGRSTSSCLKGMARLAVTEAEVKALQMPAALIVGDRDPVEKLYVAPLTRIRPDWPVTKIAGAGHITCVMKPDFRDAVAKAIAQFEK